MKSFHYEGTLSQSNEAREFLLSKAGRWKNNHIKPDKDLPRSRSDAFCIIEFFV